jgi:E3 ubiquitin-protein ligase UBR3
MAAMVSELANLLKENQPHPTTSSLVEAMSKAMEDMTNSTYMRYKQQSGTPSSQCLFLFVSSIARINLEVEVVQRGGSIVSPKPDDAAALALTPKRSCIG